MAARKSSVDQHVDNISTDDNQSVNMTIGRQWMQRFNDNPQDIVQEVEQTTRDIRDITHNVAQHITRR
jgi:hypothetical protein